MTAPAGRMGVRITIQRLVAAPDGFGNEVSGWATLVTVWSDWLDGLGREAVASGRLEAPRTATVRIRRSAAAAGITAADRVLRGGAPWNIRSVAAVGRDGALIELLLEGNGVAA